MPQQHRPVALSLTAAACLFATAYLQASPTTAYVSLCCNAPSTATAFDASNLTQTKSIATGSGGDSIVLSPDGTKMFITVDLTRELQVIEISTGAILAKIRLPFSISGTPPYYLAISPDGSRVYVFGLVNTTDSAILAVNTTTYQITGQLNLNFNAGFGPLLISPDGSQLYISVGLVNQYVQVIDIPALTLGAQIPFNEYTAGFAVTPSGLILITDTNNQLIVIDPKSATILNQFSLPGGNTVVPGNVISSPDSTTAYIRFGPSILAVNIATGATVFDTPVSYGPSQFAISPDGTKLYSINYAADGGASVSEFNIPSQTVAKTVRELGPLSSLALSTNGATLYVLNADESAIATVDVASEKLAHVVLGGVGIDSLAIAPNNGTVLASASGFGTGDDLLALNAVTQKLKFTAAPTGEVSFSPDGKTLYLANSAELYVYAYPSLQLVTKVPAPNLETFGQAIPSPDGTLLYLPVSFVSGGPNQPGGQYFEPGVIAVFDTSNYQLTKGINVPLGLGAVALTPDGTTLVCTSNDAYVFLISTSTGKVTGKIQLSPSNGLPDAVALSPDGSTAYVIDAVNNALVVINLATQTQTASIPVGTNPLFVAITPDGSEAWVATSTVLDVVDLAAGTVSTPVKLPGAPSAIVFAQ